MRPAMTLPGPLGDGYPRLGRAWTTVILLMVAYVLSFVDRTILNLLVDPVRTSLRITDFQMGLLIGPTFGIFYAFMGLPIGSLMDRRNRMRLAAGGIVLWSLMTAASGFAGSYGELFAARVGVAVGEAALSPAAHSIISDSFRPHQRARAFSVYSLGIFWGSGLALVFGGSVIALVEGSALEAMFASRASWQIVLIVVGLPGVPLALVIAFLQEPSRKEKHAAATAGGQWRSFNRYLHDHARAFAATLLAFSMMSLAGYALISWGPTYLIRSHGWPASRTGLVLGVMTIVAGTIGLICAGVLADRSASKVGVQSRLLVPAAFCLIGLVAMAALPFTPGPTAFVVIYGVGVLAVASSFGTGPAAMQDMVPNEFRGKTSAIYAVGLAAIGLGFGPPLVAWLNEVLGKGVGMNVGIAVVCGTAFAAAIPLFGWGSRPYAATVTHRKLLTGSAC